MYFKKILTTSICVLLIIKLSAQERTITGKITDIKGNPIAGVTVTAKDYPSLTTISGADGEFRIEIFDFTKTLVFTFAILKTEEVNPGDLNRLLVVMEYLPFRNPNPWHLTLNLHSARSDVYNKSKVNDQNWNYKSDPGFSAGMELDYFVTQNFGLSTGLNYITYSSSMNLQGFDNQENTISEIDQDGDLFYLYSLGSYANEVLKVKTVCIPVKLKIRLRQQKNWSYYIDLGIKNVFVLSAKVKASGNTEWQGYYPAYHVVIDQVPTYGYTDYDFDVNNSLIDYNKTLISFYGSIGLSKKLNQSINLDLGIFLESGMSDLKYNKPVYPADYLYTVGKQDKTTLRALGIIVGLRYHINKR